MGFLFFKKWFWFLKKILMRNFYVGVMSCFDLMYFFLKSIKFFLRNLSLVKCTTPWLNIKFYDLWQIFNKINLKNHIQKVYKVIQNFPRALKNILHSPRAHLMCHYNIKQTFLWDTLVDFVALLMLRRLF
jgi:hypothetical protein